MGVAVVVAKCQPSTWQDHCLPLIPSTHARKHPVWQSTADSKRCPLRNRYQCFKMGLHKSSGDVTMTLYVFTCRRWFEWVFPPRKTFADLWYLTNECLTYSNLTIWKVLRRTQIHERNYRLKSVDLKQIPSCCCKMSLSVFIEFTGTECEEPLVFYSQHRSQCPLQSSTTEIPVVMFISSASVRLQTDVISLPKPLQDSKHTIHHGLLHPHRCLASPSHTSLPLPFP